MNISITFRQMDASAAIKNYAREKVAKLQKFLRQPMTAKVTLSLDKLRHVAETRISSGGAHLEAREKGDDMYASIDRVIDKLERQIRGAKGAAQSKSRRGGATLRGGKRPRPLDGPMPPDEPTKPKARPKAKAKAKAKAKPASVARKAKKR
jgi:putative sigma-54 modulation protein